PPRRAPARPEALPASPAPGHDLPLAHHDGRLYVLARTTGTFSATGISPLVRTSQRRVSTGGAMDPLTHDGMVFLLDRKLGTLARIDPLTGDEVGAVWLEEEGLDDAAVEDRKSVE